jgi:hypothetical protein
VFGHALAREHIKYFRETAHALTRAHDTFTVSFFFQPMYNFHGRKYGALAYSLNNKSVKAIGKIHVTYRYSYQVSLQNISRPKQGKELAAWGGYQCQHLILDDAHAHLNLPEDRDVLGGAWL